jgi:hypothetical protein
LVEVEEVVEEVEEEVEIECPAWGTVKAKEKVIVSRSVFVSDATS